MLKDDFTYHAPNADTTPRYKIIRKEESKVFGVIQDQYANNFAIDTIKTQEAYDAINRACYYFAAACEQLCPPCADLSAAIRCIRLVRMMANEGLATCVKPNLQKDGPMFTQLMLARMQACAAIALADASELPPLDAPP